MYVRREKNKSGSTSIVIVDKSHGRYLEIKTIGVSSDESEITHLVRQGRVWIGEHKATGQLKLDLFEEETTKKHDEIESTERMLSMISNILINGTELILNNVFNRIEFNKIKDDVFRKLILSRLSYPASKAATVEYLKNHFDEDVNLSKIYRYLDKLGSNQQNEVQRISVEHTKEILGGSIGVMFYDVTTLYFETDREDDLRKSGFSKDGKHRNPQIILGILVSLGGYPLAYCIHYEGHTMLPVIEPFVRSMD